MGSTPDWVNIKLVFAALRNKDRNLDNVSELSDMSTSGLLFQ